MKHTIKLPNPRTENGFVLVTSLALHCYTKPYANWYQNWLETDAIDPVPHWAKAEDLARISSHIDPVQIPHGELDSVDRRSAAYWWTAELHGLVGFTVESGPKKILNEIEERRSEAEDQYVFTIRADLSALPVVASCTYRLASIT